MNDRYLFKAKRIDWKEWVKEYQWFQGSLIIIGERYYLAECRNNANELWIGEWVEIDPTTLCQCTGLKDKNGNLIWENDVVRQFADCNEAGNELYFFYQIKYDEEYARFYGHEIYTKENVPFDELDEVEVIGSVIDNPELLNE